eukprot:Clim_evm87s225 gene=Clim_evmTU87s225
MVLKKFMADLSRAAQNSATQFKKSANTLQYESGKLYDAVVKGTYTQRATVPFVITQDMKQQLYKLGYGPGHIKMITPSLAHHLIREQEKFDLDKFVLFIEEFRDAGAGRSDRLAQSNRDRINRGGNPVAGQQQPSTADQGANPSRSDKS